MLLSFSASIITLKVSIENSSYETMVNVFNLYIEDFSSNLLSITNLMTEILKEGERSHLMTLFEELMIQAILVIKRFKPRVIVQNRFLFKVLCRQLESQLKTNPSSRHASSRADTPVHDELVELMHEITSI